MAFVSFATPSLRAEEIVLKARLWSARKRFSGFYGLQKTFSLAEECPPLEGPSRWL